MSINVGEADANQPSFSEGKGLDIKAILAKYFYHWPLFVIGIMLAILFAYMYLRYTVPIYEINATLLIQTDPEKTTDPLLSQVDLFTATKTVDNEIEILKSKSLINDVVVNLSTNISYYSNGTVKDEPLYKNVPIRLTVLDPNPKAAVFIGTFSYLDENSFSLTDAEGKVFNGNFGQVYNKFVGKWKIDKISTPEKKDGKYIIKYETVDKSVNAILKSLLVSKVSSNGTVLSLSLQDAVPQRGKDILNQLISEYNRASIDFKNKATESTLRFVQGRLDSLSRELSSAERSVEVFKKTKGFVDIGAQSQIFLQNVSSIDMQANAIDIQLSSLKDVERYVDSPETTDGIPSTLGVDDQVLSQLISKLSDLEFEKRRLLTTGTINNPQLSPLQSQILAARKALKESIAVIKAKLIATKDRLNVATSNMQDSIRSIPAVEHQFIDLQRQQTLKDNLVTYLLQKREESALSYAATVSDSRTIDAAYSNSSPLTPKKNIIYLMSLFLGVAIPFLIIFLKDLLNNKIVNKTDITSRTNAPILGELMYQAGSESVVVAFGSRRAIAEQFRALRTNLQFLYGKSDASHVTLFTSSMSGEGKSFVAINLAAALSISGRRTILLELDLRKPKISKYLDITSTIGISNYLIGKATLDEIIRPSGVHENFFVIGSGAVPPNPAELLIQPEMDELIAYLRQHFDEIIIDTPPIGLVTDALILSRLADISLYIVRHGYTLKDQVTIVESLYAEKKFPKLGIIMNAVQTSGRYGYGYGYGYSYGYGYGYGYYSDDNSKKNQSWLKRIKGIFTRI